MQSQCQSKTLLASQMLSMGALDMPVYMHKPREYLSSESLASPLQHGLPNVVQKAFRSMGYVERMHNLKVCSGDQ